MSSHVVGVEHMPHISVIQDKRCKQSIQYLKPLLKYFSNTVGGSTYIENR